MGATLHPGTDRRRPTPPARGRSPLIGAVQDLLGDVEHDTSVHANNRAESDHARFKARLRPLRGLQTDRTASVVIRGPPSCGTCATSSASTPSPTGSVSPQHSTNSLGQSEPTATNAMLRATPIDRRNTTSQVPDLGVSALTTPATARTANQYCGLMLDDPTRTETLFLSWSSDAKNIAAEFKEWIENLLPTISVFFSDDDIDKGERSITVLFETLDKCSIGVLVLTQRSVASKWVHFEAGALSKGPKSRVMPLLVGMSVSALSGPLAQLQATESGSRDAMRRLVHVINGATTLIQPDRVDKQFDRIWPSWEAAVARAALVGPADQTMTETDPVTSKLDRVLQRLELIEQNLARGAFSGPLNRRASERGPTLWGSELLGLKMGDTVVHAKYGEGTVSGLRGDGDDSEATVQFAFGPKTFLLAWTPLGRPAFSLPLGFDEVSEDHNSSDGGSDQLAPIT